MIKMTYLLFPRPDLDRAEALRLWMEDHGALLVRLAPCLGVVRYAQTPWVAHPLNAALARARGLLAEAADAPLGLAELWWHSEAELQRSFQEPAARAAYRALVEDEARFARPHLAPWFSTERLVIAGDGGAQARAVPNRSSAMR